MNKEELDRIFAQGQVNTRARITGDTTKIRIPAKWEYASSEDLDFIIQEAVRLGWKDNQVQVKRYQDDKGKYTFYIEPYEEDCSCPSLLKYEDYVIGE